MRTGRLISVQRNTAGTWLTQDAAAGTTLLYVHDAVDFGEHGGKLRLPSGTVVDYIAADLELDTITTSAVLPESIDADERVTVWPDAPTYVAVVDVGGGEPVTAEVDHRLIPMLDLYLRDLGAGETVMLVEVDGRTVVERVIFEDGTIGFGSLRSGTLQVDKSLKVLTGGGEYVEIGTNAGGVAYMVPGIEVEAGVFEPDRPVSTMGRDYTVLDQATGEEVAGLHEDGSVVGVRGEFTDLSVGGDMLAELLAERETMPNRGHFTVTSDPATTMTGYAEIGFLAAGGQGYLIFCQVDHRTNGSEADYTELRLLAEEADPGNTPASPNVTSSEILRSTTAHDPPANVSPTHMFAAYFIAASTDKEVRIGLAFRGTSTTGSEIIQAQMWPMPIGRNVKAGGRYNTMGAGGSTPPAPMPPQTRRPVRAFAAEQVYSQYGVTSHAYIGSMLRQGQGGSSRYQGCLWFPSEVFSDLAGVPASDVDYFDIYLQAYKHRSAPYDRSTIRLGRIETSSPGSSAPTVFDTHNVTLRQDGWFRLPGSWISQITSSACKGIAIGRTTTSEDLVDIFNISASTSKQPKVRYRYTK